MKTLLKVLQNGENDIRFETDINVMQDPDQMCEITSKIAMTMVTKLWGGNERSVIAVIRALAIADLAASVNPGEMLEYYKQSSNDLKDCMMQTFEMMKRAGADITIAGPWVHPQGRRS